MRFLPSHGGVISASVQCCWDRGPLFISFFGCAESSLLHKGFLCLQRAGLLFVGHHRLLTAGVPLIKQALGHTGSIFVTLNRCPLRHMGSLPRSRIKPLSPTVVAASQTLDHREVHRGPLYQAMAVVQDCCESSISAWALRPAVRQASCRGSVPGCSKAHRETVYTTVNR